MKRKGEPKTRQIHFRIRESTHRKLRLIAKVRHRDNVTDLLYATALELAEAAEAARG